MDFQHADRDDSSATIFVEGEAPAGIAACLMPRRYRKQPDWWVIEVVGLEAPTDEAQTFRLSCSTEGLWGTEGIEVLGPESSVRIPCVDENADSSESLAESARSGLHRKLSPNRILRSSEHED